MAFVLAAIAIGVQGVRRPPPSDKWLPPTPRVFGSPGGTFGLKVLPLAAGGADGTLFTVGPDGAELPVWRRPLENVPVEGYVSDLGYAATVDAWGGKGKKHALVLYNRSGKTVADYSLDQLFPDMIPKRNPFILVTPSSNHWTINAQIEFVEPSSIRQWSPEEAAIADRTASGALLRIRTAWQETLLLDPDSGKVLRRGAGGG